MANLTPITAEQAGGPWDDIPTDAMLTLESPTRGTGRIPQNLIPSFSNFLNGAVDIGLATDAMADGSSAALLAAILGSTLHHDPANNCHDICSYPGSTLNAKWEAACVAMDTQRPKVIVIRRPYANEPGARNVTGRGWMWDLTAPLTFDDPCSLAHIYIYGGLTCDPAGSAVTAALHFSPTSKTEDINIYTQVSIYGADKMTQGILIDGGARIFFDSGSRIVGCNGPGIYMSGVHAEGTNDCDLGHVVSAQNRGPAVYINGTAHQIRDTWITKIHEQGTPTTGTQAAHALHVAGIVRGFKVGKVKLSAAATGIGAPTGAICYIEATTAGIPQFDMEIGSIHQDGQNNTALETSKGTYTGSTKITGLKLGRSYSSSGSTDVALSWVDECDLSNIRYGAILIDAALCDVVRIRNSDKATLTITWPTDGSETLQLWQDGVYTCTKTTTSSTANRARCFTVPVPAKFETACILDILCSGTSGESLYSGSFRLRPTVTGSLISSTIQGGANCTAHSARADLTGAPTGLAGNIVHSVEGSAGVMKLHLENNTGNSRTLSLTLRGC